MSIQKLGAALLALVAVGLQASAATIDPARSTLSVVFEQMGVPVEGQFTRFSGMLSFDPERPAAATAELQIDTASFDLGMPDFNAEVAKPEWLDSAHHPKAHYRVKGLIPLGDNRYRADGELTLKGRSKALPADIIVNVDGALRTFSGEVRFDRKQFAVGDEAWDGVVNDEVRVRFRIAQPLP